MFADANSEWAIVAANEELERLRQDVQLHWEAIHAGTLRIDQPRQTSHTTRPPDMPLAVAGTTLASPRYSAEPEAPK